jgi:signal transduction histidine kinase
MMEYESTKFRVDLRLLQELGERLISRNEIAIVELVKNSYDADAEEVTIRINQNQISIHDTGDGMGLSEIENGWLTIGSSLKIKKAKSDSGRTVLGKKGVGRLAVLKLGKTITLITKQLNGPVYKLTLMWEKPRIQLEKSSDYTPLEELKIIQTIIDNNPFEKGKGTIILIEDLNSIWSEKEIKKLKVILSKLIEPRLKTDEKLVQDGVLKEIKIENKPFEIKLFWNDEQIDLSPPPILEHPHYFLDIDIHADGNYSGQIKWTLKKGSDSEKIKGTVSQLKILKDKKDNLFKDVDKSKNIEIIKAEKPEIRCGAFSFRLNVWDLDSDEIWGSKALLDQWAGISLVRDGFSVIQPEIDWLGLDLRRVQNPTKRFSTNQVRGVLYISSDDNPLLIDKTDREGLIKSPELDVLTDIVWGILDILERKRYDLRRDKTIATGYLLSRLNEKTPIEISKNQNLPEIVIIELKDFSREITSFKKSMEEWMLSRNRMASLGILGARLFHESNNTVHLIDINYHQLEKHSEKFDNRINKSLKGLIDASKHLSGIFEKLNPFVKFSPTYKEDLRLKESVSFIKSLYIPLINRDDIIVDNQIPENLFIRTNKTDISIIFANLFDNSIYWLKNNENEKIIEIRAYEKENIVIVQFADNGPGIDPSLKDSLFEAGVTGKIDGFGLGLAIVKDFIQSYGGSITSGEDQKLGGALFEFQIPFRK